MTNPNKVLRNILGDRKSKNYSGDDDITCGSCKKDIKAAVLNEYKYCHYCDTYFNKTPFLVNGKPHKR